MVVVVAVVAVIVAAVRRRPAVWTQMTKTETHVSNDVFDHIGLCAFKIIIYSNVEPERSTVTVRRPKHRSNPNVVSAHNKLSTHTYKYRVEKEMVISLKNETNVSCIFVYVFIVYLYTYLYIVLGVKQYAYFSVPPLAISKKNATYDPCQLECIPD